MGKLLKKVRTREDKGGEHFIYAKGISSPTHVPTIWGRGVANTRNVYTMMFIVPAIKFEL